VDDADGVGVPDAAGGVSLPVNAAKASTPPIRATTSATAMTVIRCRFRRRRSACLRAATRAS
jgi:hypothetical protein